MINFNKKDAVADSIARILQQEEAECVTKPEAKNIAKKEVKGHEKSMHHKEEIDVNDRTEDMIGGRVKTKRKDDVGPGTDGKSTKVRFHAGPKNEEYETKELTKGKPPATVKTAKPQPEKMEDKEAKRERKMLGMKESISLKMFKEKYEESSIYDDLINEVLSKDASAGAWIHDFVHSDNPKFAGKSKEERKKQALAAHYAKQKNEEVEQVKEQGVAEGSESDAYGNTGKKHECGSCDGTGIDTHNDECPECGGKGWVRDKEERKKQALAAYYAKQKNEEAVEEGVVDTLKKGMKAVGKALGGPDDEGHRKDLQRKMGVPQTGKPAMAKKNEEVEQVEEGWDDMVKAAQDKVKSGPKPSGGSGVKKGSRYGGGKQADKPEHDDEKPVKEAKDPNMDAGVGSGPNFTKNESKPLTVAKHLAKKSIARMKSEMLGKAPGNN